jgi:hypothetical protein
LYQKDKSAQTLRGEYLCIGAERERAKQVCEGKIGKKDRKVKCKIGRTKMKIQKERKMRKEESRIDGQNESMRGCKRIRCFRE